jgi:hypothetical protein
VQKQSKGAGSKATSRNRTGDPEITRRLAITPTRLSIL